MTMHRKLKKFIAIGITIILFLSGCIQQKNIVVETCPSIDETLPECILEFHGTIPVNEVSKPLDLYYYQMGDNQYTYEISVDGKTQNFPLRDDFDVSTIAQGYEIQDVNQDGQNDLLIEIGLYGKCRPWSCLVYSKDLGYIEVSGFDELMIPHWSSENNMVVEEWTNGSTQYAINRYWIIGSELVLAESLTWEYIDGKVSGYTVRKKVDEEMIIIMNMVNESEIDFDYWYR